MSDAKKTPPVERIFNKHATLFRDGDRPIYLVEDGRFAFFFDSNWKAFGTMIGVERALAATLALKPVKLMNISYYHEDIKVIDAVAYKEFGPIDTEGKRHGKGGWSLYNQKIVDAHAAYMKIKDETDRKEAAARDAYKKIESKLVVDVNRHNFAGHQEKPCPPKS